MKKRLLFLLFSLLLPTLALCAFAALPVSFNAVLGAPRSENEALFGRPDREASTALFVSGEKTAAFKAIYPWGGLVYTVNDDICRMLTLKKRSAPIQLWSRSVGANVSDLIYDLEDTLTDYTDNGKLIEFAIFAANDRVYSAKASYANKKIKAISVQLE